MVKISFKKYIPSAIFYLLILNEKLLGINLSLLKNKIHFKLIKIDFLGENYQETFLMISKIDIYKQ